MKLKKKNILNKLNRKEENLSEADKYLKDIYSVRLPLDALRILVEQCSRELMYENVIRYDLEFSSRINVEYSFYGRLTLIVAKELTKSGLDGFKFINDMWNAVLSEEMRMNDDRLNHQLYEKKHKC